MRLLLAAAALVVFAFLFPIESDAALASDGVWYGIDLEADAPASIRGNHPLFHLVAWPLGHLASAAGLRHPGVLAVRTVAAICGAAALWLVAGFARGRARWFGLAAAGYALSCRTFVIEAATGENVVPGILAALAAVYAALRHRRKPVLVGALLAVALMARQDNLFLVPGVVLAALPRGRRTLGRALAFLVPVGVAVAAVYLAAWRIAAPDQALSRFLLGLGAEGAWHSDAAVNSGVAELDAIAIAAFGRHWPVDAHLPLLGAAVFALPLALGLTRRAIARLTLEPWLFGLPVAARLVFYGWFEPGNPEWQVFGLTFACAFAARASRLGWPSPFRRARTLVLAGCAAAILSIHAPYTLRLRSHVLRDAVSDAIRQAPATSVVAIEGFGAPAMLRLMGINAATLQGSPEQVLLQLDRVMAKNPGRPVLAITDRFVGDTMPHTADHRADYRPELDRYADSERVKVIRKDGLTYAIVVMAR